MFIPHLRRFCWDRKSRTSSQVQTKVFGEKIIPMLISKDPNFKVLSGTYKGFPEILAININMDIPCNAGSRRAGLRCVVCMGLVNWCVLGQLTLSGLQFCGFSVFLLDCAIVTTKYRTSCHSGKESQCLLAVASEIPLPWSSPASNQLTVLPIL